MSEPDIRESRIAPDILPDTHILAELPFYGGRFGPFTAADFKGSRPLFYGGRFEREKNMNKTAKAIARLNDEARRWPSNIHLMLTSGVQALNEAERDEAICKVRNFDDFNEDNDPYGEHDFGSIEVAGKVLFWKMDYYAHDLRHGSEAPWDPSVTSRVLTIMLAEEY